MTSKFVDSNSAPSKDHISESIFSIGLIRDSKLKNCFRHEGSKIYVEKCPLMTSSYTPEHLFKFKKNEVLDVDETRCISQDQRGDVGFAKRELYDNGTTNCMKTNLINIFKVGKKDNSCIGNNLTTATTLDCNLSNWTYDFKLM